MLNNEFEEKAISYFTPAFSYNKTTQHNMSIDISMVEESFMVIKLPLILLKNLERFKRGFWWSY